MCTVRQVPVMYNKLIVLSKILYALSALSAWDGYISVENESAKQSTAQSQTLRIQGLSSHFLQTLGTVKRTIILVFHLLEKDKSLFHMSLRPRGHSFDLPRYQYNLTRKSFIYRNLYSNK